MIFVKLQALAGAEPGWQRSLLLLAALSIPVAWLYRDSLLYLLRLWNDLSVGEYGHGYLVLAISAYLVYSKREQLAALRPCPAWWPTLLVALFSLLWLLAVLADVAVAQPVALLLLILALLWALLGHRIIRLLAYPLLFILFAIPVWFPLSPLLQDLTAAVVFSVVRILSVPAYLQENMIIVPAGILSVEEACSGLRYLLAALTLGTLYAYLNYVSLWARISVVVLSAATAVLANILRVFIVVYLGYATDMQHPLVSDHLMLGWYLFGGLVVILLLADTWLYRRQAAVDLQEASSATTPVAAAPATQGCAGLPATALAALLALLLGPWLLQAVSVSERIEPGEARLALPAGVNGWQGPQPDVSGWQPRYHGAVEDLRSYSRRGEAGVPESVSLYIAYYAQQRQGEEVVNELNRISDEKAWKTQYAHSHSRQELGVSLLEQAMQGENGQRLVWYWYNIGGHVTNNKYMAKLWQLSALLADRPHAYLVALSVPVQNGEDEARRLLTDYLRDMRDGLDSVRLDRGHE